mgnify:FL=1
MECSYDDLTSMIIMVERAKTLKDGGIEYHMEYDGTTASIFTKHMIPKPEDTPKNLYFIPPGHGWVNYVEMDYYTDFLCTFMAAVPVKGDLSSVTVGDFGLVYVKLHKPAKSLSRMWTEYISGGIHRSFHIPISLVWEYMSCVPYEDRVSVKLNGTKLKITTKCSTLSRLREITKKIRQGRKRRYHVLEYPCVISSEEEASGLIRLHGDGIIPLIGTNKYIAEYPQRSNGVPHTIPSGVEVFTQTPYSDMTKLELADVCPITGMSIINSIKYTMGGGTRNPLTGEEGFETPYNPGVWFSGMSKPKKPSLYTDGEVISIRYPGVDDWVLMNASEYSDAFLDISAVFKVRLLCLMDMEGSLFNDSIRYHQDMSLSFLLNPLAYVLLYN